MKRKDILDALNGIDFDMIEDAEEKHHIRSHNTAWIRWSAIAACLCLVVAAAIALPIALQRGSERVLEMPDDITGETTSGESESGNGVFVPAGTEANSSSNTSDTDTRDSQSETTETQPNGNTDVSLDKVDNGILKSASPEKMEVPANMKDLGTSNATEDTNSVKMTATVVQYTLDGAVVNWATEDDLIYVITEGNNRLVVIDSASMEPLSNVPLSAMPAEMNIVGDKIYISLPDLCRIDIFSKADLEKEGSLYFDHEVSSFCLDGDYIYYSEHDQHCRVFKKSLTTNTLQMVKNGNNNYFYEPKIYINKEDGILYIGETGTTGSAIYYYDANTLIQKSVFRKDNYGIMNHTRDIFHVGEYIFWGNYCLSDKNAKELIRRYGTANYGSVTFASEEMVSTYEGLFLTDTGECVIDYYEAGFNYKYVLVSESYNVFFRERGFEVDTIIGVNFEVQK